MADFSSACEERVADDESCFLLLDRNDEDLRWRLALIDSARVSLDLQIFIWARDFSGRLLISRMLKAADRGVRVRLLVDDFPTRGRDREIAVLDQHPNVEIRLWNPGSQRQLGRNLTFLARLRELNHRLHNKVLIADNRVVISGGRNIADAYFGLSDSYNFFDLDLLTAGPVVAPVSGMFDRYWNSPQAVPGVNFHRRASADEISTVKAELQRALEASTLSEIVAIAPGDWTERLERGMSEMVPGRGEVIYDKPGEREPSQDALIGLQHDLDTPPVSSGFVSLHAKAAVLDREHVFIGSFNFSPRSRNLNTEMGILVHSPEFGERVATVMDRVMAPDNAWRLRLDEKGDLSWESAEGTLTSQPSQNFWRRVQNGIFGLLPVEQHL